MTVALLAAIIIYGNLVLTGVVEEKSSRVVEVLLARCPPERCWAARWSASACSDSASLPSTALAALLASMFVDSVDLPAVSAGVLAWVLVWFVLGYALYAMIYGAFGSLASRTEDAQAVAGPVSYVLLAGYWPSFMALSADPDGMWARVLSLFPATAPLAMPGRIALGATAWWESPLAVILTLAAITGLVSFAGRVYQNAVLRTGAVIRLRDAWHSSTPTSLHNHTRPPIQKVTNMLTSPRKSLMWPLLLSTAGVLAAVLIFTLTSDAIASLIALLITFVAVRALVQHQQSAHETPRPITRDEPRGRRQHGQHATKSALTAAWALFVAAIAAFATRRVVGRTRATADEARRALPGDDIITNPTTIWNRGITISARPAQVWPWLVQMGYGRAGFYVPEWVDRLLWRVPAANSGVLLPDLQDLAVDDVVADGPDFMAYWRVRIVDPARALVYWTLRHPWRGAPVEPTDPEALTRRERQLVAGGTYVECSWGFYLNELTPGRTRLVIRTRAISSPAWLRRMPYGLVDAYLSHAELSNIKRRVETRVRPTSLGPPIVRPGGGTMTDRSRLPGLRRSIRPGC